MQLEEKIQKQKTLVLWDLNLENLDDRLLVLFK